MELLLELGTVQLDHLRKVFLHNDGLDIEEFVKCMLELLPHRYIEPDALVNTVSRLQDAFSQVDVNGDGNMSWEEMMAALIDAGSPQVNKALKNPFNFVEHEGFPRSTRHSLRVSRLRFIPELQMMAACEEGRRYVVLYDASPKREASEGFIRLCEMDTFVPNEAEGGDVFDVAYMAEQNVFMLASADFSLQFWDARPLSKHLVAPPPPMRQDSAASSGGDAMPKAEASKKPRTAPGYDAPPKARERKALPPMPDRPMSLPPSRAGGLPSRMSDRPKKGSEREGDRKGTDRGSVMGSSDAEEGEEDRDATGDIIADDTGLGPENAKTGIKATANASGDGGPLFISKVHTPTPLRLLCWVGGASKLIAATSGADLLVWHVYMARVGYTSWDFRVALRGVLSVHTKIVTDMIFLRDVGMVAACSMDHTVSVWGVRGLPDGVGGRRGFSDSPSYRPGHIQKLPPGSAAAGLFLVGHNKTAHTRGVRCLLYAPSVRMMFSAGYEPYIQAWDMAMDDGTPTYKLTGHPESVVGMTSLEHPDMKFEVKTAVAVVGASAGANAELAILKKKQVHYAQIVSVDEKGEFRWWDCARDTSMADDDRCMQFWHPVSVHAMGQAYNARGIICTRFPPLPKVQSTAEGEGVENGEGAMASVKAAARGQTVNNGAVVIGLSSRMKCFEAVRQDDDRATPAAGLYHDVTMSFLAVTQQDIRVFDAANGLMSKVYRGALPSEAANNCVTFDSRRRKLLVGCNGGTLLCINTFNCRVMKALPRHSADVSGLLYCEQDSTVLSTGWDGRLHVVDETITEMDGKRVGLMRRVKRAHGPSVPITALAFDHALSLIATAGGNGVIRLWDYQDLSFQGELIGHDAEVTALAFASPWPALVSTDLLGVVNVWHVARSETFSCLASMAHRPHSSESPPPASAAEEALVYQGQLTKSRVASFVGMAARRLHSGVVGGSPLVVGGPGASSSTTRSKSPTKAESPSKASDEGALALTNTNSSQAGSKPRSERNPYRVLDHIAVSAGHTGLAQTLQDPVTSMAILSPTAALAETLVTTAGMPIRGSEGGFAMVASAGDAVPRAFPTLILGDEQGRVSMWDMGHVLGPISIELGPAPAPAPAAGSVIAGRPSPRLPVLSLEEAIEREGGGARLLTATESAKRLPGAGQTVLEAQAGAGTVSEPAPSLASAQPGALDPASPVVLHIRTSIEPLPLHKQPPSATSYHPRKIIKRSGPPPSTGRPMLYAHEAELIAHLTEQRAEQGVKGGNRRRVPPSRSSRGSSAKLTGSKASASDSLSYAAQTGRATLTRRRAGPGDAPGGLGNTGAEYDNEDAASTASSEDNMDLSKDVVHAVPNAVTLPGPATVVSEGNTQVDLSADSSVLSLKTFPSTFDDGMSPDGVEVSAPSRSLPVLARLVGDTWLPVNLVYAHGLFYDASMTDDPTAGKKGGKGKKSSIGARMAMNGSKSGWKGFPVRSVRLAGTAELVCLVSGAEDGTLRMMDLRGKMLGALPLASGRRGIADPNAAAAQGKSVVTAAAQSLDWKVSLDLSLRDRVLTSHAQQCLARLDAQAEQDTIVQAAVAEGRRVSVEYADIKEMERRGRRTSMSAVSNFLESGDAKRKAQKVALQAASGGGGNGDEHAAAVDAEASSMSAAAANHDRARVIGQLFGASTWLTTGAEAAKEEALARALKAQNRRGSVGAAAAKALGVNVLQLADADSKKKAAEADFSGPVPDAKPLEAPPRMPDVPDGLQPSRPNSGAQRPPAAGAGGSRLMDALMSDPSVRTLVELAQADAAERHEALLQNRGRKKALNVIGLSGSVSAPVEGHAMEGGREGEDEDEDEDEDAGDDDERPAFDVAKMMAGLTPAERRLRQVRAISARSGMDTGGSIRVNGVLLTDPGRAASAANATAKESLLYPSFFAENHRPTALQIALEAMGKGKAADDRSGSGDAAGVDGSLSPFLRAHAQDLQLPVSKARVSKASSTAGKKSETGTVKGQLPAAGAGKAAVAILVKAREAALGNGPAANRSRLAASMDALEQSFDKAVSSRKDATAADTLDASSGVGALRSLSVGTRLSALKHALSGMFEDEQHEESEGLPNNKHKSVAQLLRERNPELMGTLNAIRERKRRGSVLVSMSDMGVQASAGAAIAAEEKIDAQAKDRKAAFMAQRAAALDAAEGKGGEGGGGGGVGKQATLPRLPAPGASGAKKAGSPPRKGKGGRGGVGAGLQIDPEDMLTPEQFYLLSRRHRVGGHLRRDVLAFQALVRTADANGDGNIGYDEFTTFVESGASGMRHMKSHLESLFRSADKSGDGALSITELATVMFPKASSAELKEIVLFTTYVGPPPTEVAKGDTRVYSEDTLRQLKELFNLYDADGGGTIDRAEMAAALAAIGGAASGGGNASAPGMPVSLAVQQEAQDMMATADESGDGEIDFDEFVRLMGPAFEPET